MVNTGNVVLDLLSWKHLWCPLLKSLDNRVNIYLLLSEIVAQKTSHNYPFLILPVHSVFSCPRKTHKWNCLLKRVLTEELATSPVTSGHHLLTPFWALFMDTIDGQDCWTTIDFIQYFYLDSFTESHLYLILTKLNSKRNLSLLIWGLCKRRKWKSYKHIFLLLLDHLKTKLSCLIINFTYLWFVLWN